MNTAAEVIAEKLLQINAVKIKYRSTIYLGKWMEKSNLLR